MADLWGENDEDEAEDMLPDGEEDEEDILDMEGDTNIQQAHTLLMRFCPHDSSMLYPQVSSCFQLFFFWGRRSLIIDRGKLPYGW